MEKQEERIMTETKLYDKVYGAVMGFAVGDALGVPVEEMHYRNIRKQYGEVRRMLPVAPRLLGGQPHYEQSINHGAVSYTHLRAHET